MHSRETAGGARRNDPWRIVARWPAPEPGRSGLPAQAKLAWQYLYQLAGGIDRSVSVLAANVGAEQGTSDRSGRRALESLAEVGLIQIADRFKGQITVYLNDPAIAARARLASATNLSDQGELEFPSDHESLPQEPDPSEGVIQLPPRASPADLVQEPPAVLAQDPPRQHRTAPARAIETSILTSNIQSARKDVDVYVPPAVLAQDPPPARTAASPVDWRIQLDPIERRAFEQIERQRRTAKEPAELPTIGPAVDAKLRSLPTPGEKIAQAQQWVEWMRERIADPTWGQMPTDRHTGLRGDVMLMRIACAIIDGLLPMATLESIFKYLNQTQAAGKLRVSRAAYFMGAIKQTFANRGLNWRRRDDA
jgi:hypothetical protein